MRYNWPMSAHASQAFGIAHCTDSEDLPCSLLGAIAMHYAHLGLGLGLGLRLGLGLGLRSGLGLALVFSET